MFVGTFPLKPQQTRAQFYVKWRTKIYLQMKTKQEKPNIIKHHVRFRGCALEYVVDVHKKLKFDRNRSLMLTLIIISNVG